MAAGDVRRVLAGAIGAGHALNAPVALSTSDVPITLPTGSWRYVKVIVPAAAAADTVVATALNEVAVIGTAGTPPVPIWGAGDADVGPGVELKPIKKADGSPAVGGTDVLHLIASAAVTVRIVLFR